jgi:hypothetical protein
MNKLPAKETIYDVAEVAGRGQLARLLFALLLMALVAALYTREKIDAENFALGTENVHSAEAYHGSPYTAPAVRDIKFVIDRAVQICPEEHNKKIMWLGNSQLHTINQYKNGQHLAPYWLREMAKQPDCFWPYGLSLPNANFQEYFALSVYVTSATRIDAAVLSLVFDDLREDGLRADFSALMVNSMPVTLAASRVGRDILVRYEQDLARGKGGSGENQGLEGFVQKRFEDSLTDFLGHIIPLWSDRPNLRVRLMTDLYYLRNFVFHIKANTVRKQIPARYLRNMGALEAVLSQLRDSGIPIILYIAPIRQDISSPYDTAEYESWKRVVARLAATYGAQLLNLETDVPPGLWGAYHEADVDFMHFQGDGHRLLAQAIAPALRKAIGDF